MMSDVTTTLTDEIGKVTVEALGANWNVSYGVSDNGRPTATVNLADDTVTVNGVDYKSVHFSLAYGKLGSVDDERWYYSGSYPFSGWRANEPGYPRDVTPAAQRKLFDTVVANLDIEYARKAGPVARARRHLEALDLEIRTLEAALAKAQREHTEASRQLLEASIDAGIIRGA